MNTPVPMCGPALQPHAVRANRKRYGRLGRVRWSYDGMPLNVISGG